MKPQFFSYTLAEELEFDNLWTKFSNHHRLNVFVQKGCVCVSCGRVGTRLFKGIDGGGGIHVDLYTDDLVPITVDHIIPKSLGGKNHIDNYQPMCFPCNNKKGNGIRTHNPRRELKVDMSLFKKISSAKKDRDSIIGKRVYKIRKFAHFPKDLGIVDAIGTNPHTGNISAIIYRGSKTSYYDLDRRLYTEKNNNSNTFLTR